MHFFGAGTVNSGSTVATAGSGSNSILPGEWTEDGNGGHPDILASWSIGGDTGDAFVDLWPALAFITGCCAERKEPTATKYIHNEVVKIAKFLFPSFSY